MKNIGGRGVIVNQISDEGIFPEKPGRVYCGLSLPHYFLTSSFSQETLSARNLGAKILGNGLPHVGQRFANAEIYTRRGPLGSQGGRRRKSQDWHILARMVRRRPARIGIAAMIGGNHQEIGLAEQRQEWAEQPGKLFERFCKPVDVFAVPLPHNEIHQSAKNQSFLILADLGT